MWGPRPQRRSSSTFRRVDSVIVKVYLADEGAAEVHRTPFIQLIELTTGRPAEVEALVDEWRARTSGRRTAQRGTFTKDRDRPAVYVQIVEFSSYADAMANSELPETASFAERLARLCDGLIQFRNLEVQRVDEL